MRPIDFEYQEHPEKRKADLARLKQDLIDIKKIFTQSEESFKAGNKKQAVLGFIKLAKCGLEILYLYEALEFSFKNKKFSYPHNIIYNLEAYLEEMKKTTNEKGEIVLAPTNPKGKEILHLTGVEEDKLDFDKIDVENLYSSAKRIMKYMDEKIFSEKHLLEEES